MLIHGRILPTATYIATLIRLGHHAGDVRAHRMWSHAFVFPGEFSWIIQRRLQEPRRGPVGSRRR